MNNYEALIRDSLAENLGILNPQYELIGKEHYIAKGATTKSFIDILAKDRENNYIIIEIKRSNQAERQAIHEIYKYVEAVKEKYKANAGEIKAVIASTSWEELLVPFSAFFNESGITVEGYHLEVDGEYKVISAKRVVPCKTSKGRLLSPVHKCNLYNDEKKLKKGLKNHHQNYRLKGFEDYVLFVMAAPQTNESDYKKRLAEMSAAMIGSEPDYEHFATMILPKFMIYSAFHRLPTKNYWEILKTDPEIYKQTEDYLKFFKIKDQEAVDEVLENDILGTLKPYFYSDECESGSPAKLVKILTAENWTILEIIRSDSLKANTLLTDEKIISEMMGDSGASNAILRDSFVISGRAKFLQMKENSAKALKYNEVWKNHLRIFFDDIESLEGYDFGIEILNTTHILLTFILIAISGKRNEHLPKYIIRVNKNAHEKFFLGTFKWNGKKPHLNALMNRCFNGNPENFIMTLNWGGFDRNNDAVLEELGLSFESYLVEVRDDQRKDFVFRNYRFEEVGFIEDGIDRFMNENSGFVEQLAAIYKKHTFSLKNNIFVCGIWI
ncbi:endonuclease NucS domain-containing protein [Flavobacterium sp. Root901]|uniref:endonuclease NucS domain-containing protein n=1 Tax=Flavobacterium sp. Root901 TaxID=1736605 RepID=UPI000AB4F22F|nr:endonuclease NucS domain-containing protein [Flavobacterium sp. Root901]